MPASQPAGVACLERAYEELDLLGSDLIEAASTPPDGADPRVWREVGDWLLLGERVGAERIFFVHDDPVLVFSSLPSEASEQEIMAVYRRAWCMARPRCLFLAIGPELRVYALDDPPVAPDESDRRIEPLEIVNRGADVGVVLRRFHRDRLESGATFEDADLSRSAGRADQRLLRDVQAATAALIDSGLEARDAHALIERAILVRYLEDRGVLTHDYFEKVAGTNAGWRAALEEPASGVDFGTQSRFIRCLADWSLTYALFDRLAADFNGDLFVPDAHEQLVVTAEHLHLLRDLLQGVAGSSQEPLFLWAYDFGVVPTSLVSTMYELFYHQELDEGATNTHYTPPELVEFVLADLLRPEVLERAPTICDPACGSGIFLVEAYRRIVRYEAASTGKALSTARLRALLLERIAGCDIDESAIRLAAFSLYVAFLNYQSPQDILQADPLPPLIHRENLDGAPAPLIVADAFSPAPDTQAGEPSASAALPWRQNTFSVVVGNPPWSEPRAQSKSLGEEWAKKRGLPVGDRSPSQLFLWRALNLLEDDGVAALLVSAKVLFNVRSTSRAFRTRWLTDARVERVVNFSQVRRDFFEKAVAPFALVRFRRAQDAPDGPIVYETARPVPRGRRGSAAFARLDRRIVDQGALRNRDYLWKTYSAGSHRDAALLARLELDGRLRDLLPNEPKSQYGYQRARADERSAHRPDKQWQKLPSLANFDSWGPLRDAWLETVPHYVKFAPDSALFRGRRLLVRRGVASAFGPHARLVAEPLAFRHTTYGIPLGHRPEWEAQVALGTLLSALGRYWLYMVSGSWGTWNDEIRAEHLLDLPLRLDRDHPSTKRIVTAIEQLPYAAPLKAQLSNTPALGDVAPILVVLDQAISDLFEMTAAEHDLVNDFWAARQATGTAPVALPQNGSQDQVEMPRYLDVFRTAWRPQLAEDTELDGQLWQDPSAKIIAAVFETRHAGKPAAEARQDEDAWSAVLKRYDLALNETQADGLLTYGMVRAVTDTTIIIVKRNEHRLWSPTAAREDAEATIAQVMALQRT
jgi:hypothetical protein